MLPTSTESSHSCRSHRGFAPSSVTSLSIHSSTSHSARLSLLPSPTATDSVFRGFVSISSSPHLIWFIFHGLSPSSSIRQPPCRCRRRRRSALSPCYQRFQNAPRLSSIPVEQLLRFRRTPPPQSKVIEPWFFVWIVFAVRLSIESSRMSSSITITSWISFLCWTWAEIWNFLSIYNKFGHTKHYFGLQSVCVIFCFVLFFASISVCKISAC